jgi:monoamine oxidase
MNRIDFLKRLFLLLPSTTFAASMLEGCDDTTTPNPSNGSKTILVIGAGMAGLTTARKLKQQGFKVTVLEARNRMGGRIWTDRSLGVPMDMGASWIHGPGGSNPITPLAKEANATTFLTDDEALVIYDENGKRIEDTKLDDYYAKYTQLLKDIAKNGNGTKNVQDTIKELNPSYLTDLLMLWQLSAYAEFDTGGDIRLLSSRDWENDENFSGKDVLFPNGYDAITNLLAKDLDVQLNQIVTKIDYSVSNKVSISTAKTVFEGDAVVVTVPLGVLQKAKIAFQPTLNASKMTAIQQLKMGSTNKVALLFPSTFWDNDAQYIGYTDAIKGKFNYFMNLNKFVPNTNGLMTFGFGNYSVALENQTDAALQAEIMTTLKTIYGNAIPTPSQLLVSRWNSDPYAFGSYSFAAAGSSPADFTNLATPIGKNLFFAGEHTNLEYRGTVHGAFLSGERAAEEVRLALGV